VGAPIAFQHGGHLLFMGLLRAGNSLKGSKP
jgi:hypothetical protein